MHLTFIGYDRTILSEGHKHPVTPISEYDGENNEIIKEKKGEPEDCLEWTKTVINGEVYWTAIGSIEAVEGMTGKYKVEISLKDREFLDYSKQWMQFTNFNNVLALIFKLFMGNEERFEFDGKSFQYTADTPLFEKLLHVLILRLDPIRQINLFIQCVSNAFASLEKNDKRKSARLFFKLNSQIFTSLKRKDK